MSDEELERALRAALRSEDPGDQFTRRLLARLQHSEHVPSHRGLPRMRHWLPPTLAACLLAGIGLSYQAWQQQQRERSSGAQLLQALNISSGYVNMAREAVIHEESASP